MKKIVSLLGIFALCAASFTACNKVTENDILEKGKHFVKITPVMNETRTVLEEDGSSISVKWSATDVDYFHVWENSIEGLAEATLNDDNTIATITGAFDDTDATEFVYSSCFATEVDVNGNPIVSASQTSTATSYDPDADILIGEDIEATSRQEDLLVNFSRPVAFVKMTLKGLEVGESVTSVFVTSKSGKMTGVYNRANGAFDFTNGEETIVVCPTGVTVGSDGTAPVYFVSAPVDNATLEIEVWTSKGGATSTEEYHYKKEFTKGISFPANKLTRFTANVTCCEVVPEETGEVTIFNETFAGCDYSAGGNDNNFATASNTEITSSTANDKTDIDGWSFVKAYPALACVKIGGSSSLGSATTPALGITAETATLTFRAAAFKNDAESTTLKLFVEGNGELSVSNVTLTIAGWENYTVTITGGDANTKIKFEGGQASKGRFFLDDVKVSEVRVSDPNVVNLQIADNTEINGSETEATVTIQSNKAWTVTSSDALLANTPIKINGTAQTTSFTVAFAEANTSVTEAKVATLHVVAGAGEYAVEKDITITQKAVTPYITILAEDRVQTVAASATSTTFHVSACNFDWNVVSVTIDGETNPNYTATKGNDGIVTVSFPSNEANGATTLDKVIEVTVGDAELATKTCTITQQGETYVDPNKRYYVKVTENQTDWTGNYLIVSGQKALPGQTISGATHSPITVSVAGNMIEATSTEKVNSVFISEGSTTGQWYIQGLSGYYGGSNKSFLVQDEGIDNEISYANDVLTIMSNELYLRYNSGASTGPFRYYGNTTTGSDIELYKFNGTTSELFVAQLSMGTISVDAGDGTLTFSWEAVQNAQKYLVYWNGSTTPEDNEKFMSYTKTGLANGTEYSIEVVAVGDGTFYTNSQKKSAVGTPSAGGGGDNDVEVLNEEFDNTSTSDSSTTISSTTFANFSGATSKAYKSKYGGIKFGTGSAVGYITSKSLDLSNSFTVKINVRKYGSDTGKVQVTVGSVTKEITPTETDTQYTLNFDAATSSSTVKIGTSSNRAYIDNVIIVRHD